MKATISFTLDTEADQDILRWLETFRNRERSEKIREALRNNLQRGAVTLADVYQAIKELKRAGITTGPPAATPDEPPDVAAALDQLGL